MTLAEARMTVRDRSRSHVDLAEAASVLTTSDEATGDDLIACLDHDGLPNELARIAIARRLKRDDAGIVDATSPQLPASAPAARSDERVLS